jgi:hypothetical protein
MNRIIKEKGGHKTLFFFTVLSDIYGAARSGESLHNNPNPISIHNGVIIDISRVNMVPTRRPTRLI